MSERRILINNGTYQGEIKALTGRLKGVIINYRFGMINEARARKLGRRIIETTYDGLLDIPRRRIHATTGRLGTLTEAESEKLASWKEEAIGDFEAIIHDSR